MGLNSAFKGVKSLTIKKHTPGKDIITPAVK